LRRDNADSFPESDQFAASEIHSVAELTNAA
jgi:hypothetical protein